MTRYDNLVLSAKTKHFINDLTTTLGFILRKQRYNRIFVHEHVRHIQEVVVLALKCALAIAAVMAIYCLIVVLIDRLSD